MPWLKQRGQNNTASPAPASQPAEPVPMYNFNQSNQWQANDWFSQNSQEKTITQNQQRYWEPNAVNTQQHYNQNAQQFQQHHNQNTLQPLTQPQQVYQNLQSNQEYTNNTFQSVPLQSNEVDTWGNWGWGDEDNSNVQSVQSAHLKEPVKPFEDLTNNAAATNEESWNWSVEDNPNQQKPLNFRDNIPSRDTESIFPKNTGIMSGQNDDKRNVEETVGSVTISSVNDRRNELKTPQWSMDSQVSQESSDDILQTSESDNHLFSSSTVSHSPLSGLDTLQPAKEDVTEQPTFQTIENREVIKNEGITVGAKQANFLPPSLPPTASAQEFSQNPYKRNVTLGQKNFPSDQFGSRPPVIQHQLFNQAVNLETIPDNSEHPDISPGTGTVFNVMSYQQRNNQPAAWQDNNEAPINDRNQYLETGQLSDVSFPIEPEAPSVENRGSQDDTLPPPGLRRMVLGQMEQQGSVGNVENFGEEPPPGLSRMVLGQNESVSITASIPPVVTNDASNSFQPISPPEGLRRMVPGESSSPETSSRQLTFQSDSVRSNDFDTEFDQIPQLRSATIGADTPPATSIDVNAQPHPNPSSRSETIGAADSGDKARGSSVSPSNDKKVSRRTKEKKFENQRRGDFIQGQQANDEINSVVSGVRNLTVGENSTDETNENVKPEPRKKLSRHDTSESENERREKSPREKRDRRYREDKRERDHYSPEHSRDRRYERRKHRGARYEDNAEYFSDGDRDKSERDKDYDYKYRSLRKDKDKDRRRRESPREYDRRRNRGGDHYYRYDDSFENDERSRPSSRSDSMHESSYKGDRRMVKDSRDRRRDRPRDRDKPRKPRDPYNPYGQGYGGYDPYNNPYYQQYQYQYYENLRRTNPQAYAEIYRKYYEQQTSRQPPGYGADDRSSVHSGRSSANEELTKDSFSKQKDQTDSSILEKSGRVTPAKFNSAHMKISIDSGRLIRVLPNYPQDGQTPLVEITDLGAHLQKDDEFKELVNYPGPLIKDVTHKKTVIEYCENKIRNVTSNLDISDPDSYILMWEFLILLLRQNGKVVGTDIAELLLKSRTEPQVRSSSVLSNLSSSAGDAPPVSEISNIQMSEALNESSVSVLKEVDITNKFREYLLYGSGQEALEWAMKNGLWGHALFLASKLGKRTYSNVMVRFANGLTFNDPLQTLYQLLSRRMPAAVTSVADEKWGDWKPHLAMIISNSGLEPDLNRKAITTLGDTLMLRGSLYAAQFCYLMAEVGFGRYGQQNVKVVLLGSNHNKPFNHFATNEAIHMTEIYEYACSLNDPEFTLSELQPYKYLLAARLSDYGLLEKSLTYLEKVAVYISNNPSNVNSSLVNNVLNLADKLKYCDPVGAVEEEDGFDMNSENRLDNLWLKKLRMVQNDIQSGLISNQEYINNDVTLTEPVQSYDNSIEYSKQEVWQQQQQAYEVQQYQVENSQAQWKPEQPSSIEPSVQQQQPIETSQQEAYSSMYQPQEQNYWNVQQQWGNNNDQADSENAQQNQQSYYGSMDTRNEDEPKPQISMPNQSKGKSYFDDEPLPHEKNQKNAAPSKVDSSKQQAQNNSGWFGGIFSKLALKPKNQMKLPDDKNPTIVWDQEKRRWVNIDEDNNNPSNDPKLPPPPKITEMKPVMNKPPLPQSTINNDNYNISSQTGQIPMGNNNQIQVPDAETNIQQGNIFKLQKSRNLKKSYVDVFNPGGVAKPAVQAPMPNFPLTNAPATMNFFIPPPVNDPNAPTNFLTQGNPTILAPHDDSQLSRWSSASSLSREVQHYMKHKPSHPVR